MSGNPFRRSKLPPVETVDAASATKNGEREQATGNVDPTKPPKRTTKKRVQIVSPNSPEFAYTPADNERRRLSASNSAKRSGSPPPPPVAVFDGKDEDGDSTTTTTTTGDSALELDEASQNARRNSGSLPPVGAAAATGGGMKFPYNPFAKTLAPRQAQNGIQQLDRQGGLNGRRQVGGRAAMDVDAFKNILMTGSAAPSPPSGQGGAVGLNPAVVGASRQLDSSSNTDTSSIFDPRYDLRPESPRTSFDDYEDASGSEHGDDQAGLMGEGRSDDLAPPAPPKPHTHPRGPQTVSFADFDDAIPHDFHAAVLKGPVVNPQLASILRPSANGSNSDLNKPLPPPPPPQDLQDTPPPGVPDKETQSSRYVGATAIPAVQDANSRKAPAPPPPPPSRRKPGEAGRARSASNLSIMTQDSAQSSSMPLSEQQVLAQQHDDSSNKLAPPPPPARKAHSSSQAVDIPHIESHHESPASQYAADASKSKPPPPPRRHMSKSGSNAGASKRHSESPKPAKPGDAFLAAFSTGASTPPAPPPRRPGSKRSSIDGPPNTLARRFSVEYQRRSNGGRGSFDSERSVSGSSLHQVPEPGEYEHAVISPSAGPQRDVLADMSAFQAEIDALRAQADGKR